MIFYHTCIFCGKEHVSPTKKLKYCSYNCRAKDWNMKNKKRKEEIKKICPICGIQFTCSKYKGDTQKFCSLKCNRKNQRSKKWYKDYMKEYQIKWRIENKNYGSIK